MKPQATLGSEAVETEQIENRKQLQPGFVRLPRSVPSEATSSLSVEDTGDQSSRNLWQVYGLGGFLVARWLWGRWSERRGRRADHESGDSQS